MGLVWPAALGTNGRTVYWDYYSFINDQRILVEECVTAAFHAGDIVGSEEDNAYYFDTELPGDFVQLSLSDTDPTRIYAGYRDIPGRGRVVLLGPFNNPSIPMLDQYAMIRDACDCNVVCGTSLRPTATPISSWTISPPAPPTHTPGTGPGERRGVPLQFNVGLIIILSLILLVTYWRFTRDSASVFIKEDRK
jgi:hypothetical protein